MVEIRKKHKRKQINNHSQLSYRKQNNKRCRYEETFIKNVDNYYNFFETTI